MQHADPLQEGTDSLSSGDLTTADTANLSEGSARRPKVPSGPTPGPQDEQTPLKSLLCFSHLRWNFVYQRPQHLLTRAAAHCRIYYVEEPLEADVETPLLRESTSQEVLILTPLLPRNLPAGERVSAQRKLLDEWMATIDLEEFIAWYYTPMALPFTDHLQPAVTVYDCMDQLSAFRGAPPALLEQEQLLFKRADVVFAGGRSLYEAKRMQHGNVHLFPSSVDREHFGASRASQNEPDDQRAIPHPRIGFFGVLDERLNQELLREAAACEPSWQFVLIGPVVKIDEGDLPRASNIHYLGHKPYDDLPLYLAHWDVAMLPFAQNEATRFISPTKTPEYLAAGKPVVSTPVADVVEPYGSQGLARIASNAEEFCAAIRQSLEQPDPEWLTKVDIFLRKGSWNQTFREMWKQVLDARVNQTKERAIHV